MFLQGPHGRLVDVGHVLHADVACRFPSECVDKKKRNETKTEDFETERGGPSKRVRAWPTQGLWFSSFVESIFTPKRTHQDSKARTRTDKRQ